MYLNEVRTIVIFVVIFFLFFSYSSPAFAQLITATSASQMEQPSYTLPYPGLLPDNPLYFLKAMRDKVVSTLITDPAKKAEFDLLTSDKRINAAWMLAQQGKDTLVVSTISKSNNYFSEAIGAAQGAKRSGRDAGSIIDQLKASVIEHQRIAKMIEKVIGKQYKAGLGQEEKRIEQYEKLLNVSTRENFPS